MIALDCKDTSRSAPTPPESTLILGITVLSELLMTGVLSNFFQADRPLVPIRHPDDPGPAV